ncbi:ATP-dependent zinc protease family protein [Desulfuromonas thiophila]|uniref:ATP-dependent zinc protease family protein n=1 Tax=Desulfuromonas thiophila TaxID=57664 RepID=UPI0024A908C8|nr:ATP-dependent zinc protease [Desulfuromonas thiophila]
MSLNSFWMARTLRTVALFFLTPLLSACLPEYLLVEQPDWQQLQQRVQQQQQQLDRLQDELGQTQQTLRAAHLEVNEGLRELDERQRDQLQRQMQWEDQVRALRIVAAEPKATASRPAPPPPAPLRVARDKQVVGAIEHVYLLPPGVVLPARIDTGATTSSLDARNLEVFERNGAPWVRFVLVNPENNKETLLESRVVRFVRILQSNTDDSERRPVVALGVTIGKVNQNAEFTLSDRSHMDFPVLIGRNVLLDMMLVDVSEENIAPPHQPAKPAIGKGSK